MLTDIYWIPVEDAGTGSLGIMPRPRGDDWLDDEVAALNRSGVNLLVSLLEEAEQEELGLIQERAIAIAAGIEFVGLPMPDRGIPADDEEAGRILGHLATAINDGRCVVVHCRQGIGRAGLIACALLMQFGHSTEEAIRVVSAARNREVPETPEQIAWLYRHGTPS